MEITEAELWRLSYYRLGELTGALLVGRLARTLNDAELRVFFTEQFAVEARHAWLWTDTIVKLGGTPLPIKETHQSIFVRLAGRPTRLLDILACTKVFEDRVLSYFQEELERPELHPLIAQTIRSLLADEEGHSQGIQHFLDRYAITGSQEAVDEALARFKDIDRRAYELVKQYIEKPWEFLHLQVE